MENEGLAFIGEEEHPDAPELRQGWAFHIGHIAPKNWQPYGYLEHHALQFEDEVRVISWTNARVAGQLYISWQDGERDQQGTASALRTESRSDPVGKFQRRLWLLLICVSIAWGGLSGAAFSLNHFFITPSDALLGSFGIIALALTLFRLGRAD